MAGDVFRLRRTVALPNAILPAMFPPDRLVVYPLHLSLSQYNLAKLLFTAAFVSATFPKWISNSIFPDGGFFSLCGFTTVNPQYYFPLPFFSWCKLPILFSYFLIILLFPNVNPKSPPTLFVYYVRACVLQYISPPFLYTFLINSSVVTFRK